MDTSWFCPYYCATVDTAFVPSEMHRKQDMYIYSPNIELMIRDVSVAIGIARIRLGASMGEGRVGWSHLAPMPYSTGGEGRAQSR